MDNCREGVGNSMKTYRERINDVSDDSFGVSVVKEEDVCGMLDELESKVADIIEDIEYYDVKSALEKLKELLKELY